MHQQSGYCHPIQTNKHTSNQPNNHGRAVKSTEAYTIKVKIVQWSPSTIWASLDLWFLGRELVSDVSYVCMCTPGRGCQYSPPGMQFTFPVTEYLHHCPSTGTNLHCSVTDACVWTTCPRLLPESTMARSRTHNLRVERNAPTRVRTIHKKTGPDRFSDYMLPGPAESVINCDEMCSVSCSRWW